MERSGASAAGGLHPAIDGNPVARMQMPANNLAPLIGRLER
jgi:hypothetical protein